MKKILLLGGSAQQIAAIKTAKRLGYGTVLCDYLSDNPGQYHADIFYQVSTTDKDAVLKVAQKEQVDGVLAYASDPAAPTAAFVAEQLGLPGNPYSSVEILCNKDKFRKFLADNGFNTPRAKGYFSLDEALYDINQGCFKLPVIIKPVDSSGSKGVTVLKCINKAEEALQYAFSFSRCGRVIVEEYVEMKGPYLIGGDVFVIDGKIELWGFLNCHRDKRVNPLVPVGKSYPPDLDGDDILNLKSVLQEIVSKLHIHSGAMNVELVINKQGDVFPIDIGPRCGGNMIPELLGMIFNADIVEMSIKAAMGLDICFRRSESDTFYATYNLHSVENGYLDEIFFSDEIEKCIVRKNIYNQHGDKVECFDNASKALGVVFMKFNDRQQQKKMLSEIDKHIDVKIYHRGGGNS